MKDNEVNKLKNERELENKRSMAPGSCNMNYPELQEIIDGIIKAQELKLEQQLAKELAKEAKSKEKPLGAEIGKRIKQSHVERLEAGRADNSSRGKNGRDHS